MNRPKDTATGNDMMTPTNTWFSMMAKMARDANEKRATRMMIGSDYISANEARWGSLAISACLQYFICHHPGLDTGQGQM